MAVTFAAQGGPMKRVSQVLEEKRLKGVISVEATAPVQEAMQLMVAANIGALVVVDEGQLAGLLSERDYVRRIAATGRSPVGVCVAEVASPVVSVVSPSFTTEECMALMTSLRLRHLPVVDGGHVRGVVSIGDMVKDVLGEQRFVIEQLEAYIARVPNA